jgi:hypothetical protein
MRTLPSLLLLGLALTCSCSLRKALADGAQGNADQNFQKPLVERPVSLPLE